MYSPRLEFDNKKYLIKLYLKAEKPSKDRMACILALMKSTIPTGDYEYAILDVRNGKIYIYENQMDQLIPLVEGEASNLQTIIRNIF